MSLAELDHDHPVLSDFGDPELTEQGIGIRLGAQSGVLHPRWLRDRSTESGQIDPNNRQRLFTPVDVEANLLITDCVREDDELVISFSDGHVARLGLVEIFRALGWLHDPEEPPSPEPWTSPVEPFPYVDWARIARSSEEEQTEEVVRFLVAFYRHGYVVFRNTPTEPGTLRHIASRLGYLVGTNFDDLFDVRVEKNPTDLAFTSIELLAHTDLPYRQPVPGIQMLHCLNNEAPGGDSTLVDGLAAASVLSVASPDLHQALVETELRYRYDIGTDTVVSRGFTLDYDANGRFRQMRFNTKIDEPILRDGVDLDQFYEGRLWLTKWLNDREHQVTFRLEPGDVMFMDNHRVLHGRTEFDSSLGARHLQGCYIEHDGPDTLYRLASRHRSDSRRFKNQ